MKSSQQAVKSPQQTTLKENLKVLPPPTESPLRRAVGIFLLDCEARNLSPRTLGYYEENLRPFVAYVSDQGITALGGVTTNQVRGYLVFLQTRTFEKGGETRTLSAYTVHGLARAMRAFFNFCVVEELLPDSPMKRVRMPKLPKDLLPPFEPEEVRALVAACTNIRDKAILYVMLDSGVRVSELLALNVGDVNRDGCVSVRHGKGDKGRVAFLGLKSRKELQKYLLTRSGSPAEPLFTSARGERLKYGGVRAILEKLAAQSGVKDVHPHRFRRTFCLWSLDAGMDLASLSRIMGHSDLQTTMRYLDHQRRHLEKAHHEHGAVDSIL